MIKDTQIGKFQLFHYPPNAKQFTASDYSVDGYNEKVVCPTCGKISDSEEEHGDAYMCGGCESSRQRFGNALFVWNDLVKIRSLKIERLTNLIKQRRQLIHK